MTDPRLLTVAEGLGEIAAGNMSGDEWFSAYADTPDELGAYLWRPQGDDRGPLPATAGDLAGVPVAVKDIFCIEGLPTTAGSRILEHVEAIGGLHLDGVEPTTHVVTLENVLRPDEPVPSLDRDRALAGAPDSAAGSFRVPSPQA